MKTWRVEFGFFVNAETKEDAIIKAVEMESNDNSYIHTEELPYDPRFDEKNKRN